MGTMSRAEIKTLDNEMLLRWLTYLSRFRAEDIGLHNDGNGNWVVGDRRPSIEDVEDELVRRGLNTAPDAGAVSEKERTNESSRSRGIG